MANPSRRLPALALAAACSLTATGALAEPPGNSPQPVAATVLGTEIRSSDPEELRYLILRGLTDRYAAGRGIEVTPAKIDAYVARMAAVAERDRRFLEDQQKRGVLAIADERLEAAFWRYYRVDAIHSFYPAGSADEARAFASPWWLAE